MAWHTTELRTPCACSDNRGPRRGEPAIARSRARCNDWQDMAAVPRDPRVTNQQGVLTSRSAAGIRTLERMSKLFGARAAAEATFAKELERIAQAEARAEDSGARKVAASEFPESMGDAEAAAAVRAVAESFRAEAQSRAEFSRFLREEVAGRVASVVDSIRSSRMEVEVSYWPSDGRVFRSPLSFAAAAALYLAARMAGWHRRQPKAQRWAPGRPAPSRGVAPSASRLAPAPLPFPLVS